LSESRARYAARRSEAQARGREDLVSAYQRLGLLTEVWECLRDGSPVAATEVARFCEETASRLDAATEAEAREISLWAIRESASHWGDYLGLIEPAEVAPAPAGPPRAGTVPHVESDSSAADDLASIDAATLFKMLTGSSARASTPPVERRAKGKSAINPSAASAYPRPATPKPQPPKPQPPKARPSAPTSATVPQGPPPAAISPMGRDPVPVLAIPAIDADLRETFLAEATDLFERIEGLVLGLGRSGGDAEGLHELGRCLHTLKGAAGSVDLTQVVFHLHEVEESIEAAGGKVSDGLIDSLHASLRFLETVFQALRGGGAAPVAPVSEPARKSPPPAPESPRAHDPEPTPPPPVGTAAAEAKASVESPPRDSGPATPSEGPVRVPGERIDELMDLVSELITRRGLWAAQSESMKEFATTARNCRVRILATIDRIRDLHPEENDGRPLSTRSQGKDRGPDLHGLLRRLAEQTDDLAVLAESAQATAKPLADSGDLLARQTLQLWDVLQAIRIVPVKGLFQRLYRVAHDAARFEGRQVEVATVGEETGLDRAVQDKAFEPLLHIVRNAVCHGIESPEERRKAGKPPTGKVTLEASRAGNTLVLTVRDDGKGLDYEAIAAKGRRLGLIGPEDHPGVERLNALVFQPGFSTRDSANAMAGRGVGMDVVAQEVARLHGSVSLSSRRGEGTRLSIALPARLALEQVMILRVQGQAFALPMELIERAEPYQPEDVVGEAPMATLRIGNDTVPLIGARQVLGLPAGPSSCPMVLLVRAEGEPLAVVVDGIEGTRELVIKPLATLLAGHPIVSGVGHSVSGEVVFTLSPVGLARWRREARTSSAAAGDVAEEGLSARRHPILVVDDSLSVRTVAARHLRGFGYEVEEASDGLEALGRLRSGTYSLVLTDLEMPRMDGFELIAELVRLGITPALPVLMASTRSDPETRRKAVTLGARAFLPKPIDPEELSVKVRALALAPVEPAARRPTPPREPARRSEVTRPAVL
ncbi:MAG: response regulator, partial [Isosphaeraceae bacterium]